MCLNRIGLVKFDKETGREWRKLQSDLTDAFECEFDFIYPNSNREEFKQFVVIRTNSVAVEEMVWFIKGWCAAIQIVYFQV